MTLGIIDEILPAQGLWKDIAHRTSEFMQSGPDAIFVEATWHILAQIKVRNYIAALEGFHLLEGPGTLVSEGGLLWDKTLHLPHTHFFFSPAYEMHMKGTVACIGAYLSCIQGIKAVLLFVFSPSRLLSASSMSKN